MADDVVYELTGIGEQKIYPKRSDPNNRNFIENNGMAFVPEMLSSVGAWNAILRARTNTDAVPPPPEGFAENAEDLIALNMTNINMHQDTPLETVTMDEAAGEDSNINKNVYHSRARFMLDGSLAPTLGSDRDEEYLNSGFFKGTFGANIDGGGRHAAPDDIGPIQDGVAQDVGWATQTG